MTHSAAAVQNCYWQRTLKADPQTTQLNGTRAVDVAVIGGGYTGLSAAYHLKTADPAIDVAVLEAETIGFGASGRNAGFVMTLFGASAPLMKLLHGRQKVREAHDYMVRAIDNLDSLITQHGIDCDFERTGFLRVATTPAYEKRIREEIDFFQSLGVEGFSWVDRDELAGRVRAPSYRGACWEPDCALLDPVKWLFGLLRIARDAGVDVFERSAVTMVRRAQGRFQISTANGTITADKVVYATNGYSHLLPGMGTTQAPAFTYVIVTEPLSPEQLASIGWQGREGIEDGRNFMHYYRLTADNRLLVGGGPGALPFGKRMDCDASPAAWRHLEAFIGKTFPSLRGVKVAYRWGGAFSMTPDFTPQVGLRDGGASVYSVGCTGHGVALTQMNGQIIRDLILERTTDLTDLWFVNHRSLPMPPEPIRSAVAQTVAASMALDDWLCERAHA